MKLYICDNHDGGSSVIIAASIQEAMRDLDVALVKLGLKPFDESPYTLRQIPMSPEWKLIASQLPPGSILHARR